MASPAELAKLIANMKRGTALVDRAVQAVDKDAAVMDRFEARLDVKDGFMSQIAEYERQMAAMDAIGNGGPPLDEATFPPADQASQPPVPVAAVTSSSSFDHATGDPIKS